MIAPARLSHTLVLLHTALPRNRSAKREAQLGPRAGAHLDLSAARSKPGALNAIDANAISRHAARPTGGCRLARKGASVAASFPVTEAHVNPGNRCVYVCVCEGLPVDHNPFMTVNTEEVGGGIYCQTPLATASISSPCQRVSVK